MTATTAYRVLSARATLLGSTGDTLENLCVGPLADGSLCWVVDQQSLYYLDKNSTAPVSFPTVIAATPAGRWIQYDPSLGPPLSNAPPLDVGATSPGVSTDASRADHVHAHGAQGGGNEHLDATPALAGFMSAADKSKLDGLPANAVPDTRQVLAGNGLSGGGSLTSDVTLSV